jgi:hypothetical protein
LTARIVHELALVDVFAGNAIARQHIAYLAGTFFNARG